MKILTAVFAGNISKQVEILRSLEYFQITQFPVQLWRWT